MMTACRLSRMEGFALRLVLLGLVYLFLMALLLAAGFFPVVALAGHSGALSGAAAAFVWALYGLAVLLGPGPVVRWLHRRLAAARKNDD
jgi:hypothetical protein